MPPLSNGPLRWAAAVYKLHLPAAFEFLVHRVEVHVGAFDLGEEFFFLFHDAVFDLLAEHPDQAHDSLTFSGNLLGW